MRPLHHLPTALIGLLSISHLSFAASPTSFCKCTCGANSTIIPLDGPLSGHPPRSLSDARLFSRLDDRKGWPMAEEAEDTPEQQPEDEPGDNLSTSQISDKPQETSRPDKGKEGGGKEEDRKEYRAGNCNDCNRQFCLEYMNLPICKGKGAEEIFTTCFQRDSRKDEAVVFIFIVATAGLLLWAAVKPWVGKWIESARQRRSYIPLPGEGEEH